MHNEYNTTQLLIERAEIEKTLKKKHFNDKMLFGAGILCLSVLGFLAITNIKGKSYYRKKYDRLILNDYKKSHIEISTPVPNINPEITNAILEKLEEFEKNKIYLQKDMTLQKMAVLFNSNTRYISAIILHYKNKKSVRYINDLRIFYIVELLKNNPDYRNYTYKALAEESGFNTTQHFTNAFSTCTGITPKYFIKQII